jgi:hypothetical protein
MSTMLQGFICGAYVCPHPGSNCNSWWVAIQSQLIELFGATNFGWNNIMPLHNSTLLNVNIKQMWCLILALSRLSQWTDVEISGEFAPCCIHNWLWLDVEFAMTGAFAPKQSSQCTDVIFDCAPGAITTAPAISYLYEKAVASLAMCHCQTTMHGLKCGCHCHCVVAVAAFVRQTIWNWS